MRDGFERTEFVSALDVEAHKALIPRGATVKGMQLQAIVEECSKNGAHLKDGAGKPRRYVGYRDYPGPELLDLLALAAERIYPSLPRREGVRRLGRIAFPTLQASLIGRVLFATVGHNVHDALRLVSKGYSVSASSGKAELLELTQNDVVIRLTDMYSFVDCWHVGILEGVVESFGLTPLSFIKRLTIASAEIHVHFR